MNSRTIAGRGLLALVAAAAVFLALAPGAPPDPAQSAPAARLTSGGENDTAGEPGPDRPSGGARAGPEKEVRGGAGDETGQGRGGKAGDGAGDEQALAEAFLVLMEAVGLDPEEVADCADAAGSCAEPSARDDTDAPGADSTITIADFAFGPELTVSPGETVTVVNEDSVAHDVTSSAAGAFLTGTLEPGQSTTITAPTEPGRYDFACSIHPEMTGALVVSDGAPDRGRRSEGGSQPSTRGTGADHDGDGDGGAGAGAHTRPPRSSPSY